MARSRSSRLASAAQTASRHLHWFVLGGGLSVTALCTAILLDAPVGPALDMAQKAGKGDFASGLLALQDGRRQSLVGIGGETFAPGATATASEDIVIPADNRELAKVVLEDGADRRCLTVTGANGQTLSFRILGVRPVKGGQKTDEEKVELAVAACARNGQSVVKAVMEPEAGQQPAKPATSGHSL